MGIRPVSDLDLTVQSILVDQAESFRSPHQSVANGIVKLPPTPSATQQEQINFISGVDPGGVVVSPAYATWDSVAHSNNFAGPSSVAKWGAGNAGTTGGTVTYFFDAASSWTATEQAVFVAAYALWADVANIQFAVAADAGSANILIKRGTPGSGAFFTGGSSGSAGAGTIGGTNIWHFNATGAFINLATADSSFGPVSIAAPDTAGGHVWGTIVHEEGHSLGLGHSGAYNGNVTSSTDQFGAQDNTQFSIMSYIDPTDATAKFFAATTTNWGVSPDSFPRSPTTFMMLDILAAQELYGVPVTTAYSGGQIYGFNCNIADASKPFYDFTVNSNPVVTIWNAGTGNTLDLSGYSTSSSVNLNPGTFSSCNGMVNNIGIAFSTAIDKFVGGTGADTVTGNNNGDLMDGSFGGNDSFTGGTANDGFSFAAAFTTADFINGGAGTNDQVALRGDYAGGITITGAQFQNVEVLVTQPGFSYFVTLTDEVAAAGTTFSVWGVQVAAANSVNIVATAETNAQMRFFLGQGADNANGGQAGNLFYGEGGADSLTGGAGADTFAYLAVSESTGGNSTHDSIRSFTVAQDKFDLPTGTTVTGIDAAVTSGTLNSGNFDADLQAAIGAGQLLVGHAVTFHATTTDYAVDNLWLIVDANNVPGYQAGADYVFNVTGSDYSALATGNFI